MLRIPAQTITITSQTNCVYHWKLKTIRNSNSSDYYKVCLSSITVAKRMAGYYHSIYPLDVCRCRCKFDQAVYIFFQYEISIKYWNKIMKCLQRTKRCLFPPVLELFQRKIFSQQLLKFLVAFDSNIADFTAIFYIIKKNN